MPMSNVVKMVPGEFALHNGDYFVVFNFLIINQFREHNSFDQSNLYITTHSNILTNNFCLNFDKM
jgi:hypothetical protein